jgi:flagellar biosynthesis/type III secretory pathway M-ring protein FliF/YscJ
MLGKALRQLDYRLSVAVLVFILAITVAAGIAGGLRVAGIVALFLFLILEGFECLWTVVTRREAEKISDELDAKERNRFYEKSKDNPTIR